MKILFSSFIVCAILCLVRVSKADVTLDLVKGVLDGKLQPVYDSLVRKGNASYIITSEYLHENGLPLPWEGFKSAPILHFSLGESISL
jgi:hypothetical protein